MDRFSRRESSSFEDPSSSSDFDFDDVFGGAPRRSSSIRYSSSGSVNSGDIDLSWRRSGSIEKKAVFGGQSVNRDDFYDDIFRGHESYTSRRMSHCDQFGSDHFSTSFTAQLSLGAKLNKSIDHLPARFSSQAVKVPDRSSSTDVRLSFRSSLSHEFSPLSDKSSYTVKSARTEFRRNFEEDPKSPEAPIDSSSPLLFSVNNWSCRRAPLVIPLCGRNGLKSKERSKFEKCSSSNGRIKNDSMVINCVISSNTESFEGTEQHKTNVQSGVKACQIVGEEAVNMQCTAENILNGTIWNNKREEIRPYSLSRIGLFDEPEEKVSVITQKAGKPEEKTRKTEVKETEAKLTKLCRSNVGASENVKRPDVNINSNSNKSEVNKASVEGPPTNSGGSLGSSRVKERVKEFVNIFNQEALPKSRFDFHNRSQSSGWEGTAIGGPDYEVSVTNGLDIKIPDVSFMVDKNVEEPENKHSHIKTTIKGSIGNPSSHQDSSSFSDPFPRSSNFTLGNMDDPFQVEFLIEELPNGDHKFPNHDMQVSDAKIQQWSNGKQGNIRSLLSTLQYVLWDESGWKPVALVNLIEGSAVKRAYQKALLCLHPDKLQQKGAAPHKLYIAETVFNTLQEAWDHFNSIGPL
ncbi:hypothetical protein LguiA_003736 [Lonicera macranthoides]